MIGCFYFAVRVTLQKLTLKTYQCPSISQRMYNYCMSNFGILSYRTAVVTSEVEFLFRERRDVGCCYEHAPPVLTKKEYGAYRNYFSRVNLSFNSVVPYFEAAVYENTFLQSEQLPYCTLLTVPKTVKTTHVDISHQALFMPFYVKR